MRTIKWTKDETSETGTQWSNNNPDLPIERFYLIKQSSESPSWLAYFQFRDSTSPDLRTAVQSQVERLQIINSTQAIVDILQEICRAIDMQDITIDFDEQVLNNVLDNQDIRPYDQQIMRMIFSDQELNSRLFQQGERPVNTNPNIYGLETPSPLSSIGNIETRIHYEANANKLKTIANVPENVEFIISRETLGSSTTIDTEDPVVYIRGENAVYKLSELITWFQTKGGLESPYRKKLKPEDICLLKDYKDIELSLNRGTHRP